jgi:hypothetical protein
LASDGISIAAINEVIADDEQQLNNEYQWVKENYPAVNIDMEMVGGIFMDELHEKAGDKEVALIVMGAGGNYNDLLAWDKNIVDAFIDLTSPVLIVPAKVKYRRIQKVAFAVNYYRKNLQVPISAIRSLVEFTKAKLYVIHVVHPDEVVDEEGLKSKDALQQSLADLRPLYYEPSYDNVVNAIDNFTAEEEIDMLTVIPTRHGIWHNIFHQRHTKGLVYLNRVPIMSLYQGPFI